MLITITMTDDIALLRLLQLVSPALPVGMYSYSQGLETAVADGLVTDADAMAEWINGVLEQSIMRVDVPLAQRMFDAWKGEQPPVVEQWSAMLLACRETAELRQEDRLTGQALARLLAELGIGEASHWIRHRGTSFAAMYTLAAVNWQLPVRIALLGYVWSWLENQVMAAIKLVPLGQVAGQRLLAHFSPAIAELLNAAMNIPDAAIGGGAFGLSLSSSRHETQYARLFRS